MAEKTRDEAVKNRKCALIPWALGIIGWLAIYLGCPGFLFSYGTLWLLIPFLLCLIFMGLGAWHAYRKGELDYPSKVREVEEKIDYERESFKWIDRYTANLLLAITIVIPAAVYLAGIENVFTREWWPFFLFEFLALGIAAGIILPFFWPHGLGWIVLLRHLKTVCFLYVSLFFLSGLIVLAQNVYNLIR